MAKAAFDAELHRNQSKTPGTRHSASIFLSCYLDAIPHALAREQPDQAKKAQSLVALIINDFVTSQSQNSGGIVEVFQILHQIASRFTALCLDDPWARKSAGACGIRIMTTTPYFGIKWVTDREIDLVRTLLHILKDLPRDLPRDVDIVVDVLSTVLHISNADVDFQAESAVHARAKLVHLVGLFFPELQSSNLVVRQAAQTCIELLVTLSGKPAGDLLMPHRDRMLVSIYTKPLRALPFMKQIGMIEAIRFCISLDPPLVELNEELLRLLHETLALADADDAALLGRGIAIRQNTIEVIKLRVACIKLLTASMPLTDFFQRHPQTRQRYLFFVKYFIVPNI